MVRLTKFSALSAWTHSESHLQQKTLHGAVVTVVGVLIAITLFVSEFRACFTLSTVQTMAVDKSRADFINLNVNLTFPALPCQALNVELRDIAGERISDGSLSRGGGVHKVRVDRYGSTLGVDYVYPGHQLDFAILARDRQLVDDLERALNSHEGCNLYAIMQVRRVAGSFVVSIHIEDFFGLPENMARLKAALSRRASSHQQQEAHPETGSLDVELDATRINVSHVINDVTFGPPYPGMQRPLQGVSRVTDESGGVYRYYLKVVPTVYKPLRGRSTFTNQYSVTEFYQRQTKGTGRLPGVYLLYDLSPVTMELAEKRVGFGHFLVRLCAVIGGVFAVTGLIDRWVHRLVTSVTNDGSTKGSSQHHAAYGGPAAMASGPNSFSSRGGYGGGTATAAAAAGGYSPYGGAGAAAVGGYGSGYNTTAGGYNGTAVTYNGGASGPTSAVSGGYGEYNGSGAPGAVATGGVGIGGAYNAYGGAVSYAHARGAAPGGGSSTHAYGAAAPDASYYGADKRAS